MNSTRSSSWSSSDYGAWYCIDKRTIELEQDQIPEDYEEEVEYSDSDSESLTSSGRIRYCHALLDRHKIPESVFPNVCNYLYSNLFEQFPQFIPQDIKIQCFYEIFDHLKSVYNDERNKNTNQFLIVVRFAAYTINHDYYDGDGEINEIEIGFVPASKSSIEGLEKVSGLGDGRECAICFEEEEGKKEAKRMPCGHVFHGLCVQQWLEKSHLCPMCRYAMPIHD